MKISVLELKVGDYIQDFGVVTEILSFHTEVAGDYKSDCGQMANSTELVHAEMKACYGARIDRIAVNSKDRTKCYYSDASLDVVRFAA
jgi:hypothetical protein